MITDRNGALLRNVLSRDYKTSIWKDLKEISPYLTKATIIKEDKRFLMHNGIDLSALVRALIENIKKKKICSGGSTITMQVAKMVLNNKRRTITNKIIEILYALKLELYLRKDEILEIYLNRAPYGYQTYGVEAAAQFYFNKSARDLSLNEACFLALLPQTPTIWSSPKKINLLIEEKNKILRKMLIFNLIDSTDFLCALNEPISINRNRIIFRAPHFVDFLLNNLTENTYSIITSTLDIKLQEYIEKLLFTSISALRKYNVNQGAVVVLDTRTGEILSMVGSKDYFAEKDGQVNGCVALRQPGSALKPFLYLLALTQGLPMSYLMNDTITEFKLSDGTVFAPRNFGNKYHRYVRAREALGSSFNIPAVYILNRLGVTNFYSFLSKLHFTTIFKQPEFYGLSLSLGSAEVRLLELTNAYRAIANRGIWRQYQFIKGQMKTQMGERVFSEEAAFIITDVLSDNSSRIKAFGDDSPLNLPFPCAVKTGTTKNFKDNWCVGFTDKYTVGVWVGNFDGSPMNGVSGISGAAPLFRDIMIELHRNEYPKEFERPKSVISLKVCARTGLIPKKECPLIEEIFIAGTEPKDSCDFCANKKEFIMLKTAIRSENKVLKIIHPNDGDIFKLDPQIPYRNQAISIKVYGDTSIKKVILKLNGNILCEKSEREVTFLWQPKPGLYELEATGITTNGEISDRVKYRVY